MSPIAWIPYGTTSVLDVGCNAGELLVDIREAFPTMRLAGVDLNAEQIASARARLADIDLRHASADALPFADGTFDCATCIEVLEHIPEAQRPAVLVEIGRVLRPGGLLVLRVPHAGAFAWLDSNNVRFRMPSVYAALVGTGRRDAGYADGSRGVVWHHHFTRPEVEALAGPGWAVTGERRGALFLLPLVDWACWPFYRLRRTDNPVFRALQRIAAFDIGRDFGPASFDMLLALRRVHKDAGAGARGTRNPAVG